MRAWPLTLLLLAVTRPSEACIEVAMVPRVFPAPLTLAATNAHIFVSLDREWATELLCDDTGATCQKGDFFLTLRTAATAAAAPSEIAFTTLRTVTTEDVSTLELVPSLAAKTRYELVRQERKGRRPARVIGTFATGADKDTDPPKWKGVTVEHLQVATPGLLVLCGPQTSVRLAVDVPNEPALFEVWISAPGGAVDTKKPPAVLTASEGKTLTIAGPHLTIGKDVRIAVRPVDLAGNVGTLSEVTVDTSPKAKK